MYSVCWRERQWLPECFLPVMKKVVQAKSDHADVVNAGRFRQYLVVSAAKTKMPKTPISAYNIALRSHCMTTHTDLYFESSMDG